MNDNNEKLSVALIFGGQSSEHDVSCVSASFVANVLDKDKYDITYIGITKKGHWLLVDDVNEIKDREWEKDPDSRPRAIISPDTDHQLLIKRNNAYETRKLDVAIPMLHGLFGEDGTIQGIFEMAHLPYTGCGHLSSAITMDKFFTKVVADNINVDQAAYVGVRDYEIRDRKTHEPSAEIDRIVEEVESFRDYPVFVKPSCAGSSMGITKAHNRQELVEGLKIAADNDSKILVEEAISGREIECAVFGYGDNAFAAGVGEIVAAAEFYDFDAKYNNAESLTVIDPELPEGKAQEIMDTALRIYRACDCFGFARVDFFLENGTNRVVFNEINTIPGHTSISMYPMIMEKAGYPMGVYMDKMIEMAYERHM